MKKEASTLSTFIIYLYFALLISVISKFVFHIQLVNTNLEHVYWVNIIADLSFIILTTILNFKVLTNNEFDGKSLLSKFFTFILRMILLFFIFMAVKILFSVIVYWIAALFHLNAESNNQMMIEQVVKLHPIGMLLSVCFAAPFVEELVFRGSVRKIISNDWLFVITSGLLFGLVHVLSNGLVIMILLISAMILNMIITSKLSKKKKIITSILSTLFMVGVLLLSLYLTKGNLINLFMNINMSEAVNSITYIVMGLCLAYVYKKYNNIYLCMGVHALNNIFGFLVLIFTMN